MSFKIISAGMLSTVQDLGRFGVMKTGFTQSGAMDTYSMQIANRLVGNCKGCAVIEMTVAGITAEFNDACIIALSGGDFSPALNGNPIKNNKAYNIKKGDVLKCPYAKSGVRCYLAVSGGIKVPWVLGSRSTNIKSQIGGYFGRKLQAGDVIETDCCNLPLDDISKCEIPSAQYCDEITVRAISGPQDFMFTDEDIKLFYSQKYKVTQQADRMGIRLEGNALKSKNGMDIISDGIVLGSVQVSANGQPIVLMADHQTTGGYAKIATVISCDIPLLAQAKPNDTVKFKQVTVKQAQLAAKKQRRYIESLIF
ncbi:MAG: biotin-dependent carboxyltransferase family protein [Eubacterium sp.]